MFTVNDLLKTLGYGTETLHIENIDGTVEEFDLTNSDSRIALEEYATLYIDKVEPIAAKALSIVIKNV